MYYPESDTIVAKHPDLAARVEAFDAFLAELQGSPLQVGPTADLLGQEPEFLDWLILLYESHGALHKSVQPACPSDRQPLEMDSDGVLECDLCGLRFGEGEYDTQVSYRARRVAYFADPPAPGRMQGEGAGQRRKKAAAGSRFIDFDLRVQRAGAGAFMVTSQTPGSGVAQATLDWDGLRGEAFSEKLRRLRFEPFTVREPTLRQMGRVLFDALFQGEVRTHFIGVYRHDVRPADGAYLRLRLDISEDAPELARLPWELMYWNGMFLATQVKTLLTRQLLALDYGDVQTAAAERPRVLVVIPEGSGLATDAEVRTIVAALVQAGIAHKLLHGPVSVHDVADTLAAGRYSILHFIGHGQVLEEADGLLHGSLRFNAPPPFAGLPTDEDWVSDTRLRILLGPYASLRLVILNACHGAEVTGSDEEGSFVGLGPALLKAGVPAVVAMQYPIHDNVAVRFAEVLYRRLTEGQWAGQIDAAVSLARNACFVQFPDSRGFATPVLYLRSSDGVIFEKSG